MPKSTMYYFHHLTIKDYATRRRIIWARAMHALKNKQTTLQLV